RRGHSPRGRIDQNVGSQPRRSKGRDHRSAAGAHRSYAAPDRYGHAQSHRIPGDIEMRNRMRRTVLAGLLFSAVSAAAALAQTLPPEAIVHPKADSWPTFHGDYSGRHYSPLKEINLQ